jgi:PIN domain nuclease of toxin-antitoxin system
MEGICLMESPSCYLFDTHTLIFWNLKEGVSNEFIVFFDEQVENGNVFVSSISFWETALLARKGRIRIEDIEEWRSELIQNTNIRIIDPTASDMIASVNLPDIHKDPFDRLLIIQANRYKANLVTKDEVLAGYSVKIFWIWIVSIQKWLICPISASAGAF